MFTRVAAIKVGELMVQRELCCFVGKGNKSCSGRL
jgi:hypothetical protein